MGGEQDAIDALGDVIVDEGDLIVDIGFGRSVGRDLDVAELLRRLPAARVEHVAEAGHSVQGDDPLTLARLIDDFVPA